MKPASPPAAPVAAKSQVWDPFVRAFHWLLVASIAGSLLTGYVLGASWLQLHILSGVAAVVLVSARLVWGFLGSEYALFPGFVTSPTAALIHVRELAAGTARRHLGHNPLGGWMILTLLGIIILLAVSGTIFLGGALKTGPLAAFADFNTAQIWGISKHLLLANALLLLIVLHVAGAFFESFRTRENLPMSMVDGLKQSREGDHVLPARRAHKRLAFATIGSLLIGAVWGGVTLAQKPVSGLPTQIFDPVYADECSACHEAFHPSLLTRKSWRALMASLGDHFGEDASLDAETTTNLTTWLVANAAETTDTRAAHVFRSTNPEYPFTITKTRFWQRTHARIDPLVFTSKPVYTRANCAACHDDNASGMFYPGNISIPKETQQ